ncbi:MAG: hypothetical protein KG012_19420 [Deltaproteobacteria bacterium]|nr:hypothetical protein [Deltaproteobacteria bacterium]
MRFQDAVANSNDVRDCYQAGLQALLERDKNRLSCNDPRKITGSLHLDVAVAQLYPNAARWDYGIGIKKTEAKDEAIWVEVHPADANQIPRMIDKLAWLKNWLNGSAPNLMVITKNDSPYVWVASGRVSFQKSSPQAKRLALAGIKFPQEHYRIETR